MNKFKSIFLILILISVSACNSDGGGDDSTSQNAPAPETPEPEIDEGDGGDGDDGGEEGEGEGGEEGDDVTLSLTPEIGVFTDDVEFTVNGIENGDEITVYWHSGCSGATQGTYTSSGTSYTGTVSKENLDMWEVVTVYDFSFSVNGECFNNAYRRCPNGNSHVDGTDYLTFGEYIPSPDGNFCVMKYEAREVSDYANSNSSEEGDKYTTSLNDAIDVCNDLNSVSPSDFSYDDVEGTFSLINNEQWTFIARDIEDVEDSETTGVISQGPYHTLSNGFDIYELDSGQYQWVKWDSFTGGECLESELFVDNCLDSSIVGEFAPIHLTGDSDGAGRIFKEGGNLSEVARGGGGIFRMGVGRESGAGVRCVYEFD